MILIENAANTLNLKPEHQLQIRVPFLQSIAADFNSHLGHYSASLNGRTTKIANNVEPDDLNEHMERTFHSCERYFLFPHSQIVKKGFLPSPTLTISTTITTTPRFPLPCLQSATHLCGRWLKSYYDASALD